VKFIADGTLGRLAKYLRIFGYDTICYIQKDIQGLILVAREQGRRALIRKIYLRENVPLESILPITQDNPIKQLEEVINHYNLSFNSDFIFTRCVVCNEKLTAIQKEDVEGKVPEYVLNSHATFFICPVCKRLFWPGSHLYKMKKGLIQTMQKRL